mmetsp:Transcript_20132/g.40776  ORF Transcript_20132/g.40776 Transcript_20132/m.40776 type:complete len:94 (+) Transcript_20132:183-464(+)
MPCNSLWFLNLPETNHVGILQLIESPINFKCKIKSRLRKETLKKPLGVPLPQFVCSSQKHVPFTQEIRKTALACAHHLLFLKFEDLLLYLHSP